MSVMGVVLALLWAALVLMALLPWDMAFFGPSVSAGSLAFIEVALPVLLSWAIADSASMVDASCGPFDDPRECTTLAVLSLGAVLMLLGHVLSGLAAHGIGDARPAGRPMRWVRHAGSTAAGVGGALLAFAYTNRPGV